MYLFLGYPQVQSSETGFEMASSKLVEKERLFSGVSCVCSPKQKWQAAFLCPSEDVHRSPVTVVAQQLCLSPFLGYSGFLQIMVVLGLEVLSFSSFEG